MSGGDDLLSLWAVFPLLFFAAISIVRFLLMTEKNECLLPSGPGNMEAVSLHCQSAHQGKRSSAPSGISWLSLASLDLLVICRRYDAKVSGGRSRVERSWRECTRLLRQLGEYTALISVNASVTVVDAAVMSRVLVKSEESL